MNNVSINQGIISFYEIQAESFFDKIFNCSNLPLLTDLSQLYDFNHYRIPHNVSRRIEEEFDNEKAKNPQMGKAQEWSIFSKIYNRHWNKWIVEKIKSEYGIEVEPKILMIDLFKNIEKVEREAFQHKKENLH